MKSDHDVDVDYGKPKNTFIFSKGDYNAIRAELKKNQIGRILDSHKRKSSTSGTSLSKKYSVKINQTGKEKDVFLLINKLESQ